MVGVTPSTVTNWKKGNKPDDKNIPDLAKALNLQQSRVVEAVNADRVNKYSENAGFGQSAPRTREDHEESEQHISEIAIAFEKSKLPLDEFIESLPGGGPHKHPRRTIYSGRKMKELPGDCKLLFAGLPPALQASICRAIREMAAAISESEME
jgi:hypothetical protein